MYDVFNIRTKFNIKLNSMEVWKADVLTPSHHFSGKNHNFNLHAKFILI